MPHQTWIKETLKAKGFKLKDMATALGITAPRVTDILRGHRSVQSDELQPLADLLGMSLASLLASLEAGHYSPVQEKAPKQLPLEGYLAGDGTLSPLPDSTTLRSITPPPDAQTTEGLRAFIMGDNSMAGEIRRGDIVICADPRLHYYPMVPGAIFLISCGKGKAALRQFIKGEKQENWLVPLPEAPNPNFYSWQLDILPAALATSGDGPGDTDADITDTGTEIPAGATVRTEHIKGAVLWVHRRYIPEE